MHARTSSKALFIVPGLAWLSMAFAAWWLVVERHQFGPRIPWRYDVFGRPLAWHDTTPSALVTPIAIGAVAVTVVALGNWFLRRTAQPTKPPVVQRTLSVAEIIVAVLAIETALLPAIGTRPLVLTACLGLPLVLIAIAHADLTGEKIHRDEVSEELRYERLHPEARRDAHPWHGEIVYVRPDVDPQFARKRAVVAARHRMKARRPRGGW
jgi:hypothetical protein